MAEYYYKYRSLQNLRWFIDILAKGELHTSRYLDLNDPMEGWFNYEPTLDMEVLKNIRGMKSRTYICSLSLNYNNSLMWAMYADSHCGCCIKLKVTAKPDNWHPVTVRYTDAISDLNADSTIDDILGVKSLFWKHEEEVRFIKTLPKEDKNNEDDTKKEKKKPKNSPKIKVEISEVILGYKVKRSDETFYKNLINAIFGDRVSVRRIRLDELNTGFMN